jgi:hypothetical protein
MKKLLFLLTLFFTVSTTLVSCRDTPQEESAEEFEERTDAIEEVGDEVEDEY